MRTRHHPTIAVLTALTLAMSLAVGSVAAAGGRAFDIDLSSAEEVPAPNDVASGTASLQINPGLQEVCFEITWDDVAGTVTASHIHVGERGEAGPVLVPLFVTPQPSDANGDGSASGCVSSMLHPSELAGIVAKPSQYYVNVHSTQNPPGAVRGQLG